jgi:hypothetical protein
MHAELGRDRARGVDTDIKTCSRGHGPVHRHVEHSWIVVKGRLDTVAVMHVPIEDEDALLAILFLGDLRCKCDAAGSDSSISEELGEGRRWGWRSRMGEEVGLGGWRKC